MPVSFCLSVHNFDADATRVLLANLEILGGSPHNLILVDCSPESAWLKWSQIQANLHLRAGDLLVFSPDQRIRTVAESRNLSARLANWADLVMLDGFCAIRHAMLNWAATAFQQKTWLLVPATQPGSGQSFAIRRYDFQRLGGFATNLGAQMIVDDLFSRADRVGFTIEGRASGLEMFAVSGPGIPVFNNGVRQYTVRDGFGRSFSATVGGITDTRASGELNPLPVDKMDIGFVVDETYSKFLREVVADLIFHDGLRRIRVHLLFVEPGDWTKTITDQLNHLGVEFTSYEMDVSALQQFQSKAGDPAGNTHLATFGKAYLLDLVQQGDYLLYLDVDLKLHASLAPLFLEAYRTGEPLLAVHDKGMEAMCAQHHPDYVKELEHLGLQDAGEYFNAGVLLFDRRMWREEGGLEAFSRQHSQMLPENLRFQDQTVFNAIYKGRWTAVSSRYNHQPRLYAHKPFDNGDLSELNQASVIHYAGSVKGWEPQRVRKAVWVRCRKNYFPPAVLAILQARSNQPWTSFMAMPESDWPGAGKKSELPVKRVIPKGNGVAAKKIPVDGYLMIIGAMKCATSTLFRSMETHPEICTGLMKEPEFFTSFQEHGVLSHTYQDLYAFEPDQHRFTLDASTGFTKWPFEPGVPERIWRYGIRPRFIYVVRNPIERIESQYRFGLRRSFWTQERPMLDDYGLGISCYSQQLDQYLQYFPKSDIQVLDYDELVTNTQETVTGLCSRLGLTPGGVKVVTFNQSPVDELDNLQMSEEDRARAMEHLAPDMQRLAAEWQVDISKWGF